MSKKPEQYRVLEPSYLNEGLREPGDIVELAIDYDPARDTNIEPVKPQKGEKAKTTVDAPSAARASEERTTDEGEPANEGGGPALA